MKTTLNEIRKYRPCASGWKTLLSALDKTKSDDEPLTIETIIDSNGLDDALWCLRSVTGRDREIRLYAVWCARQIQHLITDPRSITALNVSERFANNEATSEELRVARIAALDATFSYAERAAAGSAAGSAASAAWDAAWFSAEALVEIMGNDEARSCQEAQFRQLCESCNFSIKTKSDK